jgi:hypothetical protein
MRALTTAEAEAWCASHELIDARGKPHFPTRESNEIRIHLPPQPHRLPNLIVGLLDCEVNDLDELAGVEHLFWLRSRDIWPELATSIGLTQLKMLRRGWG